MKTRKNSAEIFIKAVSHFFALDRLDPIMDTFCDYSGDNYNKTLNWFNANMSRHGILMQYRRLLYIKSFDTLSSVLITASLIVHFPDMSSSSRHSFPELLDDLLPRGKLTPASMDIFCSDTIQLLPKRGTLSLKRTRTPSGKTKSARRTEMTLGSKKQLCPRAGRSHWRRVHLLGSGKSSRRSFAALGTINRGESKFAHLRFEDIDITTLLLHE